MDTLPTPAPLLPSSVDDERPLNPKLLIPRADAALHEVAMNVVVQWNEHPWVKLQWLTPGQYVIAVSNLGENLSARRRLAAERTPQLQRLMELEDQADNALPFLKGYIDEEAGSKDKGRLHYAAHGVAQKGKRYQWPTDRGERARALQMLVEKLARSPFRERKFGLAFWQTLTDEYGPLVEQAGDQAGNISYHVSKKDEAKKVVRKALKSIIFLLKANYPDTFEAELRRWGFRKETYGTT